ncbi:MAG: RNA polymerase sigma factor [Nocardioides sp.]
MLEFEARFRRLYAAHFDDILAYAVRRTPSPEDASEVVAETFLVAWRRHEDLPGDDECRLWLFGVARKVVANQVRGQRRRQRLGARLAAQLRCAPASYVAKDPADEVAGHDVIQRALAALPPMEREALTLEIWDGLTPADIAQVTGCEPAAARARLSRARRRFREAAGHDLVGDGQVVVVRTESVSREVGRCE